MEQLQQKGKGRPSKMADWLPALEEVLTTENILFLSNDDLRILTNEKLPEDQQISERTFKHWKAGKFHEDEETGKKFLKVVERALIKQKQWIGEKMLETEKNSWTRYAWLLERKFNEFRIVHVQENINKNEQTFVIQAANDEDKQLLEKIINVDFVEVKPLRLSSSNDNKNDEYGF